MASTRDKSYKHGDLAIEVRIVKLANGHKVVVSATNVEADFHIEKDTTLSKFGSGTHFLQSFEKRATSELAEHLKRRERANAAESVERFIDAARQHGEISDPQHEAGDLQEYLRVMWDLLTPSQQAQFESDERVIELLASGGDEGPAPGR